MTVDEERYKKALEKILRMTKGAEMGLTDARPVRATANYALHPNDCQAAERAARYA